MGLIVDTLLLLLGIFRFDVHLRDPLTTIAFPTISLRVLLSPLVEFTHDSDPLCMLGSARIEVGLGSE